MWDTFVSRRGGLCPAPCVLQDFLPLNVPHDAFLEDILLLAGHFCRAEGRSRPAARLEAQPVCEAFTLVQKVRFLMPGQVLWVCWVWRVCLGPTPRFQTSPQPHSILPRFTFHTSAHPSPPRTALPRPPLGEGGVYPWACERHLSARHASTAPGECTGTRFANSVAAYLSHPGRACSVGSVVSVTLARRFWSSYSFGARARCPHL